MSAFDNVVGGYLSNLFVVPPAEIFTCGICLQVLRDPKQCPKGHCFCSSCISPIVSSNGLCPICCHQLSVDNLVGNLIARDHIENQTVYCSTKLSPSVADVPNCNWSGPLHALTNHITTDCHLTPVQCAFEGCETIICRINMSTHELDCPNRKVACRHCMFHVLAKSLKIHEDHCTYRPSSCDLCQAPMQFRLIANHKLTECVNALVECPMFKAVGECSGVGCVDGKIERRLLKSHVCSPEAMADNFMSLLCEVVNQKEHCKELKKESEALKETNSTLKVALDTANEHIRALETDVRFIGVELVTRNQSLKDLVKRDNEFFAVKLFVASLNACCNSAISYERNLRSTLEQWLSLIDKDNDVESIAALHKHLTMERDVAGNGVFVKHIAVSFPGVLDAFNNTVVGADGHRFKSSLVNVCGDDKALAVFYLTPDKESVQYYGMISNKEHYIKMGGVNVLSTLFRFGNGKPLQTISPLGQGPFISLETLTTDGYITQTGNVHMLCTFMFDKEKFAFPLHNIPPDSKKRKVI